MHLNLRCVAKAIKDRCSTSIEGGFINPIYPRVLIALFVAVVTARLCFIARHVVIPGWPGDFTWALDTARDLVAGRDPYAPYMMALPPSPYPPPVPYPLPVALFGLPLLWLPALTASVTFCSLSAALLAYGIMGSSSPWRLMVFLTFPFLHALIFTQWSPLIMAAWYFPLMARRSTSASARSRPAK